MATFSSTRDPSTSGLGGSLASTATREFEITWFVVFKELFGETYWLRRECRDKDKPFIEGDLRIYDALFAGAYSGSLLRNASDPFAKGGRLQVIQHTVSFHIEASGSATPTWKFVELSANTDAPFIEASRTKKDRC